jgi:hypothetical protein
VVSAVADQRRAEAVGIELDLPDGWWSLDVRPPRLAHRLDRLLGDVLDASVSARERERVRASVVRLAAEGARCLLLRPAVDATDVAVTAGVFALPALRVDGADLYRALDERGEAVALGDLDGVPIVSTVRRVPAGDMSAVAIGILQISYLVCAEKGGVLLTFAAADAVEPGRLVRDVARVVSAARVLR